MNYGIIIKNISTLMYTLWHVDKYKKTSSFSHADHSFTI